MNIHSLDYSWSLRQGAILWILQLLKTCPSASNSEKKYSAVLYGCKYAVYSISNDLNIKIVVFDFIPSVQRRGHVTIDLYREIKSTSDLVNKVG